VGDTPLASSTALTEGKKPLIIAGRLTILLGLILILVSSFSDIAAYGIIGLISLFVALVLFLLHGLNHFAD
jgi:uncharacterized protein with PQ loop repeat